MVQAPMDSTNARSDDSQKRMPKKASDKLAFFGLKKTNLSGKSANNRIASYSYSRHDN